MATVSYVSNMVTGSIKKGKAILLKDQLLTEVSFVVSKHDDLSGHSSWHFRPEIELVYIVSGKGTAFIGNHVGSWQAGDLFLIGKNLSHAFVADKDCPDRVEAIIIKFREDAFGPDFFYIPDFCHIDNLLQNALRGIRYSAQAADVVAQKLRSMQSKGIMGLMDLLSILELVATTQELTMLNTVDCFNEANSYDLQKINRVFEYTMLNFREQITLSDVASLVNLTEAGFCRYFKARTRKSYFQYLTEVRIANACKLLQENDRDVAQACYSSGFNNPSHFHKQFKKIVNITPKEYKKKLQERVK